MARWPLEREYTFVDALIFGRRGGKGVTVIFCFGSGEVHESLVLTRGDRERSLDGKLVVLFLEK